MYFSLVRSFFGGDLTICQILEPINFTRSSYYEINEIVQASVTFSSPLCLVTPPPPPSQQFPRFILCICSIYSVKLLIPEFKSRSLTYLCNTGTWFSISVLHNPAFFTLVLGRGRTIIGMFNLL